LTCGKIGSNMSKVSRYAGISVQSSDQERCPDKLFDANADVYTVEKPHNITQLA
jgi:hypothetical protein